MKKLYEALLILLIVCLSVGITALAYNQHYKHYWPQGAIPFDRIALDHVYWGDTYLYQDKEYELTAVDYDYYNHGIKLEFERK